MLGPLCLLSSRRIGILPFIRGSDFDRKHGVDIVRVNGIVCDKEKACAARTSTTSVNIPLNADLRPWTSHRPAALYFIENPGIRATFLTINPADRSGLLVNSLAAFGYTADEFTPERSAEIVRLAVGVPDLAVKI